MNESTLLSGIFGALGVAVLLATVSKNARRKDGLNIFEYGIALKIFALLSLILPVFLSAFAVQKTKLDELHLACIAIAITTAMSIASILELFFVKISYDDKFIYTKSPWRKSRAIPIDDVLSVDYSELASWHVLKTNKHGYIRIHTGLNGHDNFVLAIKSRIHKRNS